MANAVPYKVLGKALNSSNATGVMRDSRKEPAFIDFSSLIEQAVTDQGAFLVTTNSINPCVGR